MHRRNDADNVPLLDLNPCTLRSAGPVSQIEATCNLKHGNLAKVSLHGGPGSPPVLDPEPGALLGRHFGLGAANCLWLSAMARADTDEPSFLSTSFPRSSSISHRKDHTLHAEDDLLPSACTENNDGYSAICGC